METRSSSQEVLSLTSSLETPVVATPSHLVVKASCQRCQNLHVFTLYLITSRQRFSNLSCGSPLSFRSRSRICFSSSGSFQSHTCIEENKVVSYCPKDPVTSHIHYKQTFTVILSTVILWPQGEMRFVT